MLEVILQISAAGEEALVLHLPSNPKQPEMLPLFSVQVRTRDA